MMKKNNLEKVSKQSWDWFFRELKRFIETEGRKREKEKPKKGEKSWQA